MGDGLRAGEVTKAQQDKTVVWKNRGDALFKQDKFGSSLFSVGIQLTKSKSKGGVPPPCMTHPAR